MIQNSFSANIFEKKTKTKKYLNHKALYLAD